MVRKLDRAGHAFFELHSAKPASKTSQATKIEKVSQSSVQEGKANNLQPGVGSASKPGAPPPSLKNGAITQIGSESAEGYVPPRRLTERHIAQMSLEHPGSAKQMSIMEKLSQIWENAIESLSQKTAPGVNVGGRKIPPKSFFSSVMDRVTGRETVEDLYKMHEEEEAERKRTSS